MIGMLALVWIFTGGDPACWPPGPASGGRACLDLPGGHDLEPNLL